MVDGLIRAVLPCHKWNPYNKTSHSGRDGLPCNVIDRAGNVSWKALDWATDSAVGSSTTKFILLLLANKADENFSCYPSIRTLMAESDADRSTVMRALNELEASGFITRGAPVPRFRSPAIQPLLPQPSPSTALLPPSQHGTPPSRFDTGPDSTRYGARVRTTPHRGAKSGPLEPPR